MGNLKLVTPDPPVAPEPPPEPFIIQEETFRQLPSGRAITRRTVVGGVAPEGFARWVTGIQTEIARGPAGPVMAQGAWESNAATPAEAFAALEREWEDTLKRIAAEGVAAMQRQRLQANVNASALSRFNGQNRNGR